MLRNLKLIGKKNCLYFYFKGYDKFYYYKYPFTGSYGSYSLDYCHYKYRDDYILVHIQHNIIANQNSEEIYQDVICFLENIGINLKMLEISNKLNRIDLKRDFECDYKPIIEKIASLNVMDKLPTHIRGVKKRTFDYAIMYQPKSSCGIEIIVYFKDEQLKSLKKKGVELQVREFDNVIRTEVRLKNKRLNYNIKNTFHLEKTLDNYFDESVADDCFRRYVEPIFYTEPFYRLDYALIAIQSDNRINETEAEKLCELVTDINKKGFSKAKKEYKYCDDTFNKHIKLLRSIGINPLTFDENINLVILQNFTTKEVCRDYSLYEQENSFKKKEFDEWGFELYKS